MAYVSLARKWRPRDFDDLVGQEVVRTALQNALQRGQLHQALLFTGTRGVGKTTIARILARCLNCESGDTPTASPCGTCSSCTSIDEGRFPDLFEIDAASRTKVEDTRDLLDNIPYAPVRGRVKVYLIDEVHMLSKSSFNALLKTLEEPPGHVQFLLATTDPHKLPVTVLSRCLQFHLARIPLAEMSTRMQHICAEEGVEAETEALQRIAKAGDGSLRDALSLLDQAIAFGGGAVTAAEVKKMLGSIEREEILQLIDALHQRDAAALRDVAEQAYQRGLDFSALLAELARVWQALALAQVLPAGTDAELSPELEQRAGYFEAADIQVLYQIACHARRDLDWAPDPRCGLEMALLQSLAFLPAKDAIDPGGGKAAVNEPPPPPRDADTGVSAATQPWTDLVHASGLSGAALTLADSCELAVREGLRWTLRVPAASFLDNLDNRERVTEALRTRVGADLELDWIKSDAVQADSDDEVEAVSPGLESLEHSPALKALQEAFGTELKLRNVQPNGGSADVH